MKHPIEQLSLAGVSCPRNTALAILRLELLEPGDGLEIVLDDGEPLRYVKASLEAEGHKILKQARHKEGWKLLVKKNAGK
jgi:tRNA 2-thiouridine synthesizing protein A